MKLFGKEEVNTSRQFEFDFAKALCILAMVFVHCFEELSSTDTESTLAYYIIVTVLDSIFVAGIFMFCMGVGVTYSWKGNSGKIIKRGLIIFAIGYALNFVRDVIPSIILVMMGKCEGSDVLSYFLSNDILPFAGLSLMFFGLLKKMKFSDFAILILALCMSVIGSFVRFIDLGSILNNSLAGLFIGTYSQTNDDVMACFPLCNWFIIVVIGYLYGKVIRRCNNKNRYYAISLIVSVIFLSIYMFIAIPNRLGMMNSNILYYYHFSTPNVFVLFAGMVCLTGMCYYISLLFNKKVKDVITTISVNINRTYCIHWVMIGLTWATFVYISYDGVSDKVAFISGIIIYIVANILAELYVKHIKLKKD